MGSGSLAAVSVLESKYRDGLDEAQAKALCMEAIEAGIVYDLGYNGNQVGQQCGFVRDQEGGGGNAQEC